MKLKTKYDLLITEIILLDKRYKDTLLIFQKAQLEMSWYLSVLRKTVNPADVESFNNLLLPPNKDQNVNKKIDQKTQIGQDASKEEPKRKNSSEKWVKDLYRQSVKRCHPDRLGSINKEYKQELISIYHDIVDSYEKHLHADLMVNCSKVFVSPDPVTDNNVKLLESRKSKLTKDLNDIIKSDAYNWSHMAQDVRETYVINYLKQMGVRFVDVERVKRVLRKKPPSRKSGTRPENNIKKRVVKK
jgi:hypothetical protein